MERRLLLLSISYLLFTQVLIGQGPCGEGPCEVCGISATITSISGGEINVGTANIPGQVQAGQTQTSATPFEITATTCGEINFTIELNFDWDHGLNNNWLHGISFNSSPNWSAANGILPGPGWLFFPNITGVCSGTTYGAGYYYDPPGTSIFDSGNTSSFDGSDCNGNGGNENVSGWLIDGDPSDNYGDDCQSNCPAFGFNLTYCPINGGQSVETISFYLTEDGESGGWSDSDQCVFLLAFEIIVNSAGVQLPETVGPVCPGECVQLDAGLGCDQYDWSTGEGTPQISVCPTVTSNYSVTVTGSSGCKIEGEVEVLVEACCAAGAGLIAANPGVTCPGDFINFSVANFNSDPNFTQQLLVCNADGEILQITNGAAGSISSNFCESYNIYSYNFLTGGGATVAVVGNNISALDCTTSCCDLTMLPVTFEEIPAAFVNPPGSVTVNCGDPFPTPGPLIYDNGEVGICAISGTVNPAISNSGDITIYEWTYTSPCSALSINHSQTITQTYELDAQISPTQTSICPGDIFDLSTIELINISAENLTATYHTNSPATTANQISDLIVNPSSNINYYLLISDDFGCSIELPFIVSLEVEPKAEIIATPNDILDCLSQAITLSVAEQDHVVYTWDINAQMVEGTQVQIENAGNYIVQALDTLTGCRAQDNIDILDLEEYPLINIEPTEPITCYEPMSLIDASASQAGNNIIYTWYDGTFSPIPNAAANSLEVEEGGVYYLELTDVNNGCKNIDTIIIESILNIPLSETPDELELPCDETEGVLAVTTAGNPAWMNIQWTTVDGNIISGAETIQPEINGLGVYFVEIQDIESGCKILDSILVFNNPDVPEAAFLAITDESCEFWENGVMGVNEVDGGTEPYAYTLNGAVVTEENVFSELAPGNYTLNIMDSEGCDLDTAFVIEPGLSLDLNLPAIIEFLSTEPGTVSGIANVPEQQLISIQWSPADLVSCDTCLTTDVLGENNQEYVLTITHENGCIAEANLRVLIKPDVNVYIPNVFSPNSDGANDQFTLYANEEIEKVNELLIFDRWGEVVFRKTNFPPNQLSEGWDGSFNGKEMDAGVFAYLFKVQLINGAEQQYVGDVTLLK